MLTPTPPAGSECVVYDIIVHPDVIVDIKGDPTGTSRHFLCTLAINYVEQKVVAAHCTHSPPLLTPSPVPPFLQYKAPLNAQYKLPNLKYKGSKMETQRVRARKAPVIEEVSSAPPAAKTAAAGKAGPSSSSRSSGPQSLKGGVPSAAPVAHMKPVPVQHAKYDVTFSQEANGAKTSEPVRHLLWFPRVLCSHHACVRVCLRVQAGQTWVCITFSLPGVGVDGSDVASLQLSAAEEMVTLSCDAYKPTGALLPVGRAHVTVGGVFSALMVCCWSSAQRCCCPCG